MLSHVNMLVDFLFFVDCVAKGQVLLLPSNHLTSKPNDWLVLKSKYSVKLAMAENQRVVKGVYRIPENWTRSSVSLYVIIASMLPDRMLPLSLVHNLSRHRMMLWSLPISRPPRKWLTNWNISITQHKPTASCLFLQKWNLKYHDLGVFQSLEILGGGIST